ncbi:MAG: redoxin domain-containing protein [Dehalococcoidia bacterium]
MADETKTLKVGDPAPGFQLKGTGGVTFQLGDHKGRKNVVLAFFPAAWSPVCSQQMPTIERDKVQFDGADTQVVAISVDNLWTSEAWAKNLGLSFPILSDFHSKGAVAQHYGVYNEELGLCERALIAIDKEGVVRYIDVHALREVPPNEPVLSCVRAL